MTVAVRFTLNFFNTTSAGGKEGIARDIVRKTVSFNIQSVIVIDDPDPSATAAIGHHELNLDGITPDLSLSLQRATKPDAVLQAPHAVPMENEEYV